MQLLVDIFYAFPASLLLVYARGRFLITVEFTIQSLVHFFNILHEIYKLILDAHVLILCVGVDRCVGGCV